MRNNVGWEMACPLQWPDGQPRTLRYRQQRARFKTTWAQARNTLVNEIRLLGGSAITITTDIPTKVDGGIYANWHNRQPLDTGVSVIFLYDKVSTVLACDQWDKIEHNIRALGKTVEALRGIERWGASALLKRAMSSFQSLPPPPDPNDWRRVLGFVPGSRPDLKTVKEQYHNLSRLHHPDATGYRGSGSNDMIMTINAAYEAAKRELQANGFR